MPSITDTINSLINANVDNYPNKAFQNLSLRTILLLINSQLSGATGGGFAGPFQLTQADFTSSVNCPIPLLSGLNILVFFNDVGRYLVKGTEWTDLAGGGFTIITTAPNGLVGFNATTNNYTFYVHIKGN